MNVIWSHLIVVWYNTEDSFIIGVACGKKWGLRSMKALEFEKWGLERSSITEVYAYGKTTAYFLGPPCKCCTLHSFRR